MSATARVTIGSLTRRGEGSAQWDGVRVAVPFTVPGDTVDIVMDGERAALRALVTPSPNRVETFCPWFTRCGGCATQAVALPNQLAWKRELVAQALTQARIAAPVEACVDAHGAGRRRATFHARRGDDGHMAVGFMAARSHDLVAIDTCPLFSPDMHDAVPVARAVARALAAAGKPLDIAVTASLQGLDVDVRGIGTLNEPLEAALIAAARATGIARVSNHGRIVIALRTPTLRVGDALVELPPGGFLQATRAGEEALATLVLEATRGAKRVADLFSGIGTFALRLARYADILALENDATALNALLEAARRTSGLRGLRGQVRDLARRPLSRDELVGLDAIVFDPPRAGAEEQARELARSAVPTIVGVSCNPQSFARDAQILIDGGYALTRVTPVDQFRHSAHVELVGVFQRAKQKRKRSLLG